MPSPLRARLLAAKDIPSQSETIPEWDGMTIELRGLTGDQLNECTELSQVPAVDKDGEPTTKTDTTALTKEMILRSMFDPETGEQILERADVAALWQKSARVLNRIASVVGALNGTTKETQDAMEKNSVATTSGAGASV